jgi:tetratricopeptide (TPR) repeat protein
LRDALAIHQTLGEWQFAGLTLNNIGHVLVSLRRYAEALHYLTQALDIQRAAGDSTGPAPSRTHWVMPAAAWAGSRTRSGITSGRWPALPGVHRDHAAYANALYGLGSALSSLGRDAAARDAWLAAIPVLDELGDRRAAELRARMAPLVR